MLSLLTTKEYSVEYKTHKGNHGTEAYKSIHQVSVSDDSQSPQGLAASCNAPQPSQSINWPGSLRGFIRPV